MTDDTPTGTNPIEGQVAGVLTDRELIINVGGDQGVRLGTKFRVLASTPIEVADPETGEVLGTVAREKVRVRAVEVQPRLTVCRTYRVRTVPGGPLFFNAAETLDRFMAPPRQIPETLKAEAADYLQRELPEEESFVKKGDPIVQMFEED